MVAPALIAGGAMIAGGIGGSLFGKKKAKPIDISQQLATLQQGIGQQRLQNEALRKDLDPITARYKEELSKNIAGQRSDFAGNKAEYLGSTDANTREAQDALRANLYSKTFNALPDTLQAVREASAAGGGLRTGSFQKAVSDVGRTTAQSLAEGERDIQVQGIGNRQAAQENVFNAFNNLTSRLSDQQMDGLAKVMDTGREDLIREYTTSMGLTEQETQGIIDLLNFRASGQLAADTSADANRQALYNALIGGGASFMGARAGK